MRITKKQAVVVSPLALLGVAGIAYAATLGVSSDMLGGGNDAVESNCKIQAKYVTGVGTAADNSADNDVRWHAPVPAVTTAPTAAAKPAGYYLEKVTLTPTGSDCTDATFRLTVTDSTQNQISEATGTLTGTAGQRVTLDRQVPVDQATNLYAVVTKVNVNPTTAP
jgi:hypothetical protein